MTREEALERVREISEKNNWPLTDHVSIHHDVVRPGLFFGRAKKIWIVKTDVNLRGGNRVFEFDDTSAELLRCFVLPR
jgi:hypothetical protein